MNNAADPMVDAGAMNGRAFRYYDFVMAAFVAILLLSNVIGAGKVAQIVLPGIGPWPFGAGILFFPISYVIGDVLTEVYGYARARRVIWAGTAAVVFMAFMSWIVVALLMRVSDLARRPDLPGTRTPTLPADDARTQVVRL